MRLYRPVLLVLSLFLLTTAEAVERKKCNFNSEWRLHIGDFPDAATTAFDDSRWLQVTLPYAFNGDEAFRKDIVDLTDTICWYRKHFELKQEEMVDRKYFIEFEGVRQGADFYLNGQHLGYSENGVMACGFDLTPYIREGKNVLAVRCDNSWTYESRQYQSRYQWNDRNFNANYGGIPKNVWLHVTGKLYQTLPLYSNLGTTGTYVYATDFDIQNHKAVVHIESQVRNEDSKPRSFRLFAHVVNVKHYLTAIIRATVPALPKPKSKNPMLKKEKYVPASLDDVIPRNLVCSQELRAFFEQHLGKNFRYKVGFQRWLRENAGKTYRDAVEAYKSCL